MSSFICSAKHFNSVESALIRLSKYDNEFKYQVAKLFNSELDIVEFIYVLRTTQVMAVMMQYRHHYVGVLDDEIEKQIELVHAKTSVKHLSKLGLLKALSCIRYQIEEDYLLDKSEQIKSALSALDRLINMLAYHIAVRQPGYDNEEWEVR